jgi:DNA-binding CsgD family transcriptional regulator
LAAFLLESFNKTPAPDKSGHSLFSVQAMPYRDEQDLLDLIYEAAVIPAEWPKVLDIFADTFGALGGTIFSAVQQRTYAINSPAIAPGFRAFAEAGFAENNSRVARAFERGLFGFMHDDFAMFTAEEMDRDPMYAFMRSHNLGWCVGSTIQVPSGDMLILSFERAYDKGPFSAETISYVEGFRPHLTRAALLSARLGFERAKAAAEAMGLIGLATAVIGRSKRLLVANSQFEALIPVSFKDASVRVQLVDARADALLATALERVLAEGKIADIFSIPVTGTEERAAFVLHVVPVRRAANDIFFDASCLLVATPVARKEAPQVSLLQGLFDLSAAEAKLARGLAAGGSISELALQSGLSTETLRSHLKSVFAKTGINRQSDLVALLSGISFPGSTPD